MHENKILREHTDAPEKLGPMGEEFAVATTDVAFKQMLSFKVNNDKSVMQSFLNCFVPNFEDDPVNEVIEEEPTAASALKRKDGAKQTFMDLHVKTRSGEHYIIEMQASRHEQFDERAMYYACHTFSAQLTEEELKGNHWYSLLRPTIAIQVVDYDTNRIIGKRSSTKEDEKTDKFLEQVRLHPLPEGQYTKDFSMVCQNSGQKIDALRMLQIELPRSNAEFPPRNDFTEKEWWLSILRFSEKYTHEQIEGLESLGIAIPPFIRAVFHRLDYSIWGPELQIEYKTQISDRANYKTTLEVEREEGKLEGIEEGLQKGEKAKATEIARNMLSWNVEPETIKKFTGISMEEIESLKTP